MSTKLQPTNPNRSPTIHPRPCSPTDRDRTLQRVWANQSALVKLKRLPARMIRRRLQQDRGPEAVQGVSTVEQSSSDRYPAGNENHRRHSDGPWAPRGLDRVRLRWVTD